MLISSSDEHDEVRILLGAGRSGTTWIHDAICNANSLRAIFEPLKPVSGKVPNYEYKMLLKDDTCADLKIFLESVFCGGFSSIWTDFRLLPSQFRLGTQDLLSWESAKSKLWFYKLAVKRFMLYRENRRRTVPFIKLIRANLMLEWLRANFKARMGTVVRHPGAVIESQLRLGGEHWDPLKRLAIHRSDSRFIEVLGEKYKRYLRADLPALEALAVLWCIDNQYVVERAEDLGVMVFFYENLASGDSSEWERIIQFYNLENVPEGLIRSTPSQQSWDVNSSGPAKLKWMDRLTKDQIQRVAEVLDDLKVEIYNMQSPDPLIDRSQFER